MARCSQCRYSFRTMDDEEGMHECPACGYDGRDLEPEPEIDELEEAESD